MLLEAGAGRAAFLPEAWSIASGIEEALRGMASPQSAAAERLLRVLTHRMAGSAALFGLDEVARVAEEMETAAERLAAGDGERSEALDFLARTLPVLSRTLEESGQPPADPLGAELLDFARREAGVLEDFLPELREHLDEAGEILVRMNEGGAPAGDLAALFRRMHTIKGTAFVVGCQPVGELAHRIEDALAEARREPARFEGGAVRAVLAALEVLHGMAGALSGRFPDRSLAEARDAAVEELVRRAATVERLEILPPAPPVPQAAPPAEPKPAGLGLRLQVRAVDDLLELTGELLVMRNRLQRDLERIEALRLEGRSSVERLRRAVRDFADRSWDPRPVSSSGPTSGPAPWAGAGLGPAAVLSDLELDRYDDFNVLARRLDEIAADLGEVEIQEAALAQDVRTGAEGLKRLAEGLHAGVGRLRLVPLGQVFGRCARLARRAAAAAGKMVALEVEGERVEVDAAIAEQIWDPLLHLVRNAVDHGLEAPERRLAAGKSAVGRLRLLARTEGRRVAVEVEDDGAGIDLEAVRQRALESGLRTEAALAGLDEAELRRLVFLPGLSTAAEATSAAGRGVGLDVVRTTVERLGGSVELGPAAGGGTRFRLVFPLTLVITEALLVEVGGTTLAVPATAVERIAEAAGDGVEMDGGRAPVVDLGRVLGGPRDLSGRAPVLIVGAPGRWRGLRVDRVLVAEAAVLRPLGPFFAGFDLFSGALLTREGELVLLLNVQAALAAPALPDGALPPAARPVPSAPVRVLLADDSLSVRKVLGGMLSRAGYEVTPAADGEEAAARLEEGSYDLLITDLEMPRRNGYELIAWVRQRPATAALPVMVVTTRVGEKHQDLAREHGATCFLSKPAQEALLLSTVARLTAR